MHFTTAVIATIAALASLASADHIGYARVVNRCEHPVYLWSVGSSVGPRQTIKPGGRYSELLHKDPISGGVALKVTTTKNGLYDGSPQTNFAYNLDGSTVWYDLSDVFGDPFAGDILKVVPSKTTCPKICWAEGVSPGGSQVKNCAASSDVTLTLCAHHC